MKPKFLTALLIVSMAAAATYKDGDPGPSITLTNRSLQAQTVSPSSGPALIQFTADPSLAGGDVFHVITFDPNVVVSLLAPNGMEINTGNAPALGYTYTTLPTGTFTDYIPSPFAAAGTHTVITLPSSSVPGMFAVKVDGSKTSGPTVVIAEYFSSSTVRAGLAAGFSQYQQGDVVVLTGLLFDGSTPITGASATVGVVDPTDPTTPPVLVNLSDSGPLVVTPGSGVYAGVYTPSKPGVFTAAMNVTGISASGVPFARTASTEISVLPPLAQLVSASDAGFDDNRVGLTDRVDITVRVTSPSTGNYQLFVTLVSTSGGQVQASTTGQLSAGDGSMTVSFAASDLLPLNSDGPYTLEGMLLYTDDPDAPMADFNPVLATTAAYSLQSLDQGAGNNPLTVTPISLDFGTVNTGASKDLTVKIQNNGSSPFNATVFNLSNVAFVIASPVAPVSLPPGEQLTVTVRFKPTAAGLQQGTLRISGVLVTISGTGMGASVGSGPQITPGGVVNAADSAAKVSRGALTFAYGTNLASQSGQAQSLPLLLSMNGVSVTVAGVAAPIFVVNPAVVEFQIPYEVPLGASVPVVVTNNGLPSNAVNIMVADYAVGVFQYNRTSTIIDPDIFHANGSLITPTSPAVPGESVVVIANGIGKLNNPPRTGAAVGPPYPTAADSPAITIGGVPAVTQYAGLLAGLLGIVQINVQLPKSLPSGSLPLVIQFPGDNSPVVNLYVQGNLASVPKLNLSTNSLAFGTVTLGQTKDLSLMVSNTGSAALTVSAIQISGTGFSLVSPSTPFTVQPGGSQPVTLHYAPTSVATVTGLLTILSNDPSSPTAISLSATGVAAAVPAIGVNPTSLNFGVVTIGQTKDMTITVSNTGTAQLTVSALAASTGFLVTAPVAPVNIALGGSSIVTVRFVPPTAFAVTGTLVITSNDPKNPTLIVSLSGTGTAAAAAKSVVLQVDTGTFNQVTGFGSSGQTGAAFVNRLTPPSYPATLQNVQIYFGDRTNGLPINSAITILGGQNLSGSANLSGNLTLTPSHVLALGTFSTYPVNPVTITSGDFVVGFMVDNAIGIYPADTDVSGPSQTRSYYAAGGFAFTLLDSVPGLAGNLGIRATVTVPK